MGRKPLASNAIKKATQAQHTPSQPQVHLAVHGQQQQPQPTPQYALKLKKNVYPIVMFRDGVTLSSPMRVVCAESETFFYDAIPKAAEKDDNVLVRRLYI